MGHRIDQQAGLDCYGSRLADEVQRVLRHEYQRGKLNDQELASSLARLEHMRPVLEFKRFANTASPARGAKAAPLH